MLKTIRAGAAMLVAALVVAVSLSGVPAITAPDHSGGKSDSAGKEPMAAAPEMKGVRRPVNFVFLIDVSGSMVSRRTMVASDDGGEITLFEALRQALKEIIRDERLISPESRVAFITFGTKIEEKSAWPARIESPADRARLVSCIGDSEQLKADRHGDTYMAGALDKALSRLDEMNRDTDPCTTNFVVMLTDGWDEPPPGAPLKVRTVASRILEKQNELKERLGVNTLQIRVVGLQRLPDRKAGTTTASELATLLGGEFLDVTTQGSGSVSSRIYKALQRTITNLRARLELADAASGGVADFGWLKPLESANALLKVISRSCYPETISGIKDETASLTPAQQQQVVESARRVFLARGKELPDNYRLAKGTAGETLQISLKQEYLLEPAFRLQQKESQWQTVELSCRAGKGCPPGHYLGALRLVSSAMVPELVPYIINVPASLIFEPEKPQAGVRKPGFFFPQATTASLALAVHARGGPAGEKGPAVTLYPQNATLKSESADATGAGAAFEARHINDGKPVRIETGKSVTLPVVVPAAQPPGLYNGTLRVEVDNPGDMLYPPALPYEITVKPSAWEEVAPIAVPILAIMGLILLVGFFLTVSTMRRHS